MQTSDTLQQFKREISAAGLRLTPTRLGIFSALQASSQPLQIKDIAAEVDAAHFVSVYRSVDALLKAGLIKQVPIRFKNHYELSDAFSPHHHHATCERCGKVQEINNKKIEQITQQLAREVSLQPTKHLFEIYGICVNCQSENRNIASLR